MRASPVDAGAAVSVHLSPTGSSVSRTVRNLMSPRARPLRLKYLRYNRLQHPCNTISLCIGKWWCGIHDFGYVRGEPPVFAMT